MPEPMSSDETSSSRMAPPPPLPPCRVLVRSKQKLELFTLIPPTGGGGVDDGATLPCFKENQNSHQITLLDNCVTTLPTVTAPDGSVTYVHVANVGVVRCHLPPHEPTHGGGGDDEQPSAAAAVESRTPTVVAFLAGTSAVQMMDLSPGGSYLLTWERWNAKKAPGNLKVWSTHTGTLLAAFVQKSLSRDSWPNLQWTADESCAFLLVNGTQVRVYQATDITSNVDDVSGSGGGGEPRYTDKLQIPCTTLSVQQHATAATTAAQEGMDQPTTVTQKNYYFTTFSSKTKDRPAVATIYEYGTSTKTFVKIASKSLFQAEECVTHWSPAVRPACLLTLQTAVDVTGQSYYGSSQLWLWNAAASNSNNEMVAVPLPQAGPVQGCQWLPDPGKPPSFIVIAGNMPAMASQHHGVTGAVTFLFGNNVHRNTIAIAPHARFMCLAGFGNLAGGLGFWDLNKKKLLSHSSANVNGTLRAEAVTTYGWSPDSRYFLVATTAPRMNVDNGVRLYKYTGELIQTSSSSSPQLLLPWNNVDYQPNQLLEACFVPALPHVFPDRPQSPVPESSSTEDTTAVTAQPSAVASEKKPVGRYVPPSARNRPGGSSLAERLCREKEGQLQGATKVVTNQPHTAATAANGRIIPGLAVTASNSKSKSQLKREKLKKKKEQEPLPTEPVVLENRAVPAAVQPGKKTPAAEPTMDLEKRARKLKKMLKQIEDLKTVAELNDDQKSKIASEASVREELEQLGF